MGRQVTDFRPDITHQCLLNLLVSPINKAGNLQIYIHTTNGVWIAIHPDLRVPQTAKRFYGIMVQLLREGNVRAKDTEKDLLKIIDNPITDHLRDCPKALVTSEGAQLVRVSDYVDRFVNLPSVCAFVSAAVSGNHGDIEAFEVEEIKISCYKLDASIICSRFCHACEEAWAII